MVDKSNQGYWAGGKLTNPKGMKPVPAQQDMRTWKPPKQAKKKPKVYKKGGYMTIA